MTEALTRRRFVQAGGGALALLALAPVRSAPAATDPLRRSAWTPLVGETLRLDGMAEVRLEAVGDLVRAAGDPSLRGNDDNFELLLLGPPGFRSDVHRLRHPRLGEVELFLSPVGPPEGGDQRYEVVVDRLPGPPSGPAPQAAGATGEAPAGPASTSPAAGGPAAAPPRPAVRRRRRRRRRARRRTTLRARIAKRARTLRRGRR